MFAKPQATTRKAKSVTSSSRAAPHPPPASEAIKRRAQQEAKAQTREEPVVQETEREERVQTLPRRKPRQLAQKVRVEIRCRPSQLPDRARSRSG